MALLLNLHNKLNLEDKLENLLAIPIAAMQALFYNELASGNTVNDESTSGDARIQQEGHYVRFDGTDGECVIGSTAISISTVSMFVKQLIDDQIILTLDGTSSSSISVSSGVLTFGASISPILIQVDGVTKTASEAGVILNDNDWHFLDCDISLVTGTNVLLGTDGTSFGNIDLFDFKINSGADGWYKMDESIGTVAFDSTGNKNGVYSNGYSHQSDATAPWSYQNEVGYLLSDGSTYYANDDDTGLIADTVLIPRDEITTGKARAYLSGGVQADLGYSGRVPRNAVITSKAMDFDGSTSSASGPSVLRGALSFAADFTLAMSFKYDSLPGSGESFLIVNRDSTNDDRFSIGYDGDTGRFGVDTRTPSIIRRDVTFSDTTSGHRFVLKWVASTSDLTLWLDGSECVGISGISMGVFGNTCLFGRSSSGTDYLDGQIWDIIQFDSALSDAECIAISNNTAPTTTPTFDYACHEGTGSAVEDVISDAGDLTLTNVTWTNQTTVERHYIAENGAKLITGTGSTVDFTGGVATPFSRIVSAETAYVVGGGRTSPNFVTVDGDDSSESQFYTQDTTVIGIE